MKNLDNTLTKHLVNYVQEYFDDMEEEIFACGGMREDDRLDLYTGTLLRGEQPTD